MMTQQQLIDEAHEERLRSKLKSGISTLSFFEKPLTDEGVRLLVEQRPDLVGLFLLKTKVTDVCVQDIASLENLRELNTSHTDISQDGLIFLASNLKLPTWNLDSSQFDEKMVLALAENKYLESLSISASPKKAKTQSKILDPLVNIVAQSRTIKTLDLRGIKLDGTCIDVISRMNLQALTITPLDCPSHRFGAIENLHDLTLLNLSGSQLDDDVLERILSNVRLESLFVSKTKITDRSIDTILKTQCLKALSIEGCEVSPIATLKLAEMRTIEYIEFWTEQMPNDLSQKFQAIHGGDVHYDCC